MSLDRFVAAVDAVRAFAESRRAENGTPGYQIALTNRDGPIAHIELGVANVDSGARVEHDTLYQFGSIGKSFTAICLLQLAEEGRIDLHEPFETSLPWFSVQTEFEPITTHHLLSHTAGIICGTDFTPSHPFEVWSLRHTRTTTAPGTHFHYSNVGYKALGFSLERIEGKSYPEIVQSRILDPLGMANTCPVITSDMRHRLAVAYQNRFDDRPELLRYGLVPAPWLESNSGDGSICASATDLAIFLRMLLNRGAYPGGRLLSEESFRLMSTPRTQTDEDGGHGYGYGLVMPVNQPSGAFGHGGGMVGYISTLDGDFDTGFGAVVLTNSMVGCSAISLFALDALACAAAGNPIPAPKASKVAPLTDYFGTYVGNTSTLEISQNGDELALARGQIKSVLERVTYPDDCFVNDVPGERHFPYRFERDDSGVVTGVVHGGNQWWRGDQMESNSGTAAEYAAYVGHYRSWNPWGSNFRIVVRGAKLVMIAAWGDEAELIKEGDWYRVEAEEGMPETLTFDTIVDGQALQARDMLGSTFHRVFTP